METECSTCMDLEYGDTLYTYSAWDGGLCFDHIEDIKYCPSCGKKLLTLREKMEILKRNRRQKK